MARKWFKLTDVVQARANQERTILAVIDKLAARKKAGKSLLVDKISGCLLAGAIGNAMGSPVEGRFYTEIDQLYPGGVQTVLQPSRLESEDDNQAAMHLVEAYLARDGRPVMARHLGKIWLQNMNRDGFFPLCMGNSYDLLRRGWDARITGHWNVVTGSTVMCLEPAGLFNIADPAWAAIDATAISYMYQRGLDVVAAAMMAATVAEALRPEASVDSVLQAALDVAPTTPLKTFDKRKFKTARQYIQTCLDIADKYTDVLAVRKELYEKCLFYHMIDPLELWGLALAMFKIANGDVRQAAIGGTNIGRDSDTIAGRAAMLAGTLRGASAVPKEWIKMFSPASLKRIEANAAALARLISEGKAARLKARREAVA
jgi:ADP-ribosylglycohydrolase